MGLILGPLIIFWFLMAFYSLKVGYALLSIMPSLTSVLIAYLIAVLILVLYVYISFRGFKTKKELWWCHIPMFFAFNKITCGLFLIAIFTHWFGSSYLVYEYLKPLPFIIIFTVSFGAIIGVFGSDKFMDKHQIKRIH